MSDYARRRLNREDTGVHDILRWAFGMEAQEVGAKIMRWPEGKPPQAPKRPAALRLLTALHAPDCNSHTKDERGRGRCDCGALERQTVTGSQPYQADPSRLTTLDLIAEAAMVRNRALHNLTSPYKEVLLASHTVPIDSLRKKWDGACVALGVFLNYETRRHTVLMADTARHWSHRNRRDMEKSYQDWATELRMSRVSMWRQCYGRRAGSAHTILTEWMSNAINACDAIFDRF